MNHLSLYMDAHNFSVEDRSVPITEIPGWVWGLMIMMIIIPFGIYLLVWGLGGIGLANWKWLWYTIILLLMHEGTHAVAWKFASGLPWSAFSFGVQWKTVTPYCHCDQPMPAKAYRIGAMAPLVVTGILPWVWSMWIGDPDLALASAMLISGAGGDIYVTWAIRDVPKDIQVQDHDSQAGCLVFWPSDTV